MRRTVLQTLTWATVAAAVVSALWLAIAEAEPGVMLRVTALPAGLLSPGPPGTITAARTGRP